MRIVLSLVACMVSKVRHAAKTSQISKNNVFFLFLLLYIQHNYDYLARTSLRAFSFLHKLLWRFDSYKERLFLAQYIEKGGVQSTVVTSLSSTKVWINVCIVKMTTVLLWKSYALKQTLGHFLMDQQIFVEPYNIFSSYLPPSSAHTFHHSSTEIGLSSGYQFCTALKSL